MEMNSEQIKHECCFRSCGNVFTLEFILQKHKGACRYYHRYSMKRSGNKSATEAKGRSTGWEDRFQHGLDSGRNVSVESYDDPYSAV